MAARHIPCGDIANESERTAIERLRTKLPDGWLVLSNVTHSLKATYLSDEIDLIAIGPSGVTVVEVKHWDMDYVRRQKQPVEVEADRINDKAKRIASKVRERIDVGFVRPVFLITKPGTGVVNAQRFQARGVPFFGLNEWRELALTEAPARLTLDQIQTIAKQIEPGTKVAVSGELRRFGELVNLERVPTANGPFHRVYRGQHPRSRDRVILHLFDLSASDDKQAENLARRGFEVVQRWQKSPFVPSLLDSFQEAEHYAGELFYFSLVDTEAPTLRSRALDKDWTFDERLRFARDALLALKTFHSPDERELEPLLHRNITPETLRVRHNNRPLFTGFEIARLTGAETISTNAVRPSGEWVAREIFEGGLSVADARSDTFAICKTLMLLFQEPSKSANEALDWLALGAVDAPDKRASLADIVAGLERHTRPAAGAKISSLPAPEYWDEETIVEFKHSRYRVVNRLGQGGIGQTFKVIEISGTGEEFGTYVAKVITNKTDGEKALTAYRKARQHTTHPNLSALHEIASEWQADRFAALLKWVDGTPLADLAGVVDLRAEDLGEPDTEVMLIRWIGSVCSALWQFHEVGLVHGDVSPRNIIEKAGLLVLTDYDTVTESGQIQLTHNPLYCSPEVQQSSGVVASDDLFALASSFFQVIFDRDPFVFGAERQKGRGLNWQGVDLHKWQRLRAFLDRATNPTVSSRFTSARDALEFLQSLQLETAAQSVSSRHAPTQATLSRQVAPRLRELLSAYPGSRHGNAETRGLDSEFAESTYVESGFDRLLRGEIERGEIDLVILFGNAGDGKTAFLQNLAHNLAGSRPKSQQRLWDYRLASGRVLSLNLDGSAAYQGKSANILLDSFLKPFHADLSSRRSFAHALAINSGKMLEWLESREMDTDLTRSIRATLFSDDAASSPSQGRVKLVDLNRRSLVGGYSADGAEVGTDFLDTLLSRFLGQPAGSPNDPWQVCTFCSAQTRCAAWSSVQALREPVQGALLRRRLSDSLQAAHLRGEIHITARELRAALVFTFFGLHDCEELHADPELYPAPYWDRAFASSGPASAGRQGELLAELARLDPALNADPLLDRLLLQSLTPGQRESTDALASSRRRAFFEWDTSKLADQHLRPSTLALHGAENLDRFRRVPAMTEAERNTLCRELCRGIARLEDLPDVAFELDGLPLRITPRTPTESCFWVLKAHQRFTLTAPLPQTVAGLEVLHTHLLLTYQHPEPRGRIEQLPIGLELFQLLLALKDGAQLAGAAQEGVFAHLDLFVQRVTQEDVRELYGWHPEQERGISRLRLELRDGVQTLRHEPIALGPHL